MAQQGTEEQTSSESAEASPDSGGRHRTDEESGQSTAATGSSPADAPTEKQGSAPAEAPTEKHAPSDAPTEKQGSAPAEAPTEKQRSAPAERQQRGGADTSWAEPENSPRRSVDVGEIAWRAGNVIATVVRTLALLFALVLIVNVVLVLVGVNPANGVAQFVGGAASRIVLGFRDLFLAANPTVAFIVNSLVAAAFWVFAGELVSRLIRFLAARVK